MKILAFDTSAQSASVALCEDSAVLSECQINCRLTHSQTVLPMCESVLSAVAAKLSDVELLAVSHGPGSFTGVRIGVSAVKGIAFARGLPCVGVSALEALGQNLYGLNGVVCAAMDARRDQVYTALFRVGAKGLIRLTEDSALSLSELADRLAPYMDQPVMLVGDGAERCCRHCKSPRFALLRRPCGTDGREAWRRWRQRHIAPAATFRQRH